MTDDDIEEIIKRNMNLQMNLAGIRADFEEAQQRTWVGLTDAEIFELFRVEGTADADINPIKLLADARRLEAKLKEKNHG